MNPIFIVARSCRQSNQSISKCLLIKKSDNICIRIVACCFMSLVYFINLFLPIIKRTILFGSSLPFIRSFSRVCGVQKSILLSSYAFTLLGACTEPVNEKMQLLGANWVKLLRDIDCWSTKGLVGAKKKISPSGNHRWKFSMRTDAIWVLPRPVGRQTKVFSTMHLRAIEYWYSRNSGY